MWTSVRFQHIWHAKPKLLFQMITELDSVSFPSSEKEPEINAGTRRRKCVNIMLTPGRARQCAAHEHQSAGVPTYIVHSALGFYVWLSSSSDSLCVICCTGLSSTLTSAELILKVSSEKKEKYFSFKRVEDWGLFLSSVLFLEQHCTVSPRNLKTENRDPPENPSINI